MTTDTEFQALLDFLRKVPSVQPNLGFGHEATSGWWVKLALEIDHPLAWNVVQELGHVLNYLSLDERLPTVFKPVSPPPYMNGGPREFLSWVIECSDPAFPPAKAAEWLEGRLPRPVDDRDQWLTEDDT